MHVQSIKREFEIKCFKAASDIRRLRLFTAPICGLAPEQELRVTCNIRTWQPEDVFENFGNCKTFFDRNSIFLISRRSPDGLPTGSYF